jgi:hypothetical protein
MGVVVVASAGNGGDRPYILGSPSSTPEVISVVETQVPSAKLYRTVAGAAAVIVANNATLAPGDLPPDYSYGGGTPSVAATPYPRRWASSEGCPGTNCID